MHACFNDIEVVLDLCQEAHDLSPVHQSLPVCRDTARDSLREMILNPNCFVGFNGDGVLIATAAPSWCANRLVIADVLYYARQHGLPLLREYMQWAKAFPGNKEIYLGVSFGGELGERAEALFERLQLERIGSAYRVKVKS